MKNVLHFINSKYSDFSRSEKIVAEYILKNPDEVILLSMRALAEKTSLSDNTVLRFCRSCGFSGYLDFKTALIPQVVTQKGSIYKQVDARDAFTFQKDKIEENISATIRETYQNMVEDEIVLVAKKIVAASHTIVVGLAASSGVSLILSDSLLTLGIPSHAISDRIEIERTCSNLGQSSVLVGFTTSGETREVLMAVSRAGENRAFTILISNNIAVKQQVSAGVFLLTQVPTSNIAGTYFALPRITQLALVELILSQVAANISRKNP